MDLGRRWRQDGKNLPLYRLGDDFDWYMANSVCLECVIENVQADLGPRASRADCIEEIKRLCEPSIRHYNDCLCALCR